MNIPVGYRGFNIYWHFAKKRIVDSGGRFYAWRDVSPYINRLKSVNHDN